MGELEVWVNGIINTISDVEDSTTCRDTVIALAQSFGLTGRFNLIEKSPTSERCLHPNERPLKIREKWGQGSANYFVLRKKSASPSSSRPSSSASSSHSSPSHPQSTAVRTPDAISETGDHSRGNPFKPENPLAVRPKPKVKPKPILPAASKNLPPKQPTDSKPKPVQREGTSSPRKGVEDVRVTASHGQELSHQPDLLVTAPSHLASVPIKSSSSHRGEDEREKERASEELEIMKQHEERAEVLENERERLYQVEIALKERRKQRTLERPGGDVGGDQDGNGETEQKKILQEFKWKQEDARKKELAKEASRKRKEESQQERPEMKEKQHEQRTLLNETTVDPTERKPVTHAKTRQTTNFVVKSVKVDKEEHVPNQVAEISMGEKPEDSLKVKRAKDGKDGKTKKNRERKEKSKEGREVQNRDTKEDKQRIEEEKRELQELVRAQECKLSHQKSQLTGLDAAIQALLKFESDPAIHDIQEEILDIERAVQKNQAMLNEREFWENELELERELHRELEASVGELKDKVADCNRQISQKCEEISQLSKAIRKEEEKLGLDDIAETEEVRAVKDELRELKIEYEVITENLNKVNTQLEALDAEYHKKQKELNLVKEDYEKAKEVEIEIIIPDNRAETEETTDERKGKEENEAQDEASSPSMPHRILKGSPRELAQATPSSDNPEGVFL